MKYTVSSIKARREQLGYTQEDIVFQFRKLGKDISVRTISNWETGNTYPDAGNLEVLCQLLKKPISYFFSS